MDARILVLLLGLGALGAITFFALRPQSGAHPPVKKRTPLQPVTVNAPRRRTPIIKPKPRGRPLFVSKAGVDEIKRSEGLRLSAYKDTAGHWTIGYGHKLPPGNHAGLSIDQLRADRYLKADIAIAERCINDTVSALLSQNQYDALASLIFNIGCGAFQRSTLRRRLNAGDVAGAAGEFDRWVYANKKKSPGLIARRAREKATFIA